MTTGLTRQDGGASQGRLRRRTDSSGESLQVRRPQASNATSQVIGFGQTATAQMPMTAATAPPAFAARDVLTPKVMAKMLAVAKQKNEAAAFLRDRLSAIAVVRVAFADPAEGGFRLVVGVSQDARQRDRMPIYEAVTDALYEFCDIEIDLMTVRLSHLEDIQRSGDAVQLIPRD